MKHKAKYVGDLLAGQREDFQLVGEAGRDWAQEAAERAELARQQKEVQRQAVKLQQGFDGWAGHHDET